MKPYLWCSLFVLIGASRIFSQCGCLSVGVATTYHSFGDSITSLNFNGASPGTNGYNYLISADLNLTLTNFGIGSYMAADMGTTEIYPNENPVGNYTDPIYSIMIGTNEANTKGAGAYETNYLLFLEAEIAWLTIAKKYKTFGQNASVVQGGTWTNDNTYQTNMGIQSTTNGSTLSVPITTTGGNIYLWYRAMDGNGGVFTYKLDAGSSTSVNCFTSAPISTLLGHTEGIGLVRITGVSSGTHTVLLTVTSATGAGNIVSTFGVGTTSGTNNDKYPELFVSDVIRQLNDRDSADTAAYNSDAISAVNLMAGDGLSVYLLDSRSYINDTTDMNDNFHPNNSGHNDLRNGMEPIIKAHL